MSEDIALSSDESFVDEMVPFEDEDYEEEDDFEKEDEEDSDRADE